MAKTTTAARGGRNQMFELWSPPRQSLAWNIPGIVLRHRAELAVIAVLVTAWVLLAHYLHDWTALLVLTAVVVAVFLVPHSRRYVVARGYAVVDRHRIRACLIKGKIRTMNRDGSLPFLLWARPTKTGERVWAWLRAGVSAHEIEDACEYIAPACWARTARVERYRSIATLVAIDIVRRDPLATSHPIDSPLTTVVDITSTEDTNTTGVVSAPVISVDIPTQAQATAPAVATAPAAPATPATPVTPVGKTSGEDVSEYL